jgi:hypothetical protein
MSEHPGVSYSGLPGIDWATTKGYYRMIDKPDESAVCMSNILLPHRKRTIQRMSAVDNVAGTHRAPAYVPWFCPDRFRVIGHTTIYG